MFLLFLPLFYVGYFLFWLCVLGVALVVWVSLYIIVFLITVVAMIIGANWRPAWDWRQRLKKARDPRRPIPQARWSNRR